MTDPAATGRFEEALHRRGERHFVLKLYIVGAAPASQRAIANLTALCEQHLPGRHTLEIIDIYQQPALASTDQIIAAPTLVRLLPEPVARVVGDLSDRDKVLVSLDIETRHG
jgi:circadian clock protein KaiB